MEVETIEGFKVLKKLGVGSKNVILFHGFGASADDLYPLCQLDESLNWFFPEGSLTVHNIGHAWFPIDMEEIHQACLTDDPTIFTTSLPPKLQAAKERLRALMRALNLPAQETFLGGFSQGAIVAIELALEATQTFKGLLIFSGALVNEKGWKERASHHKSLAFFQSHGTKDPLLSFARAQKLEQLLLNAGLQGKLHAFEGGHEIPLSILTKARDFLHHT